MPALERHLPTGSVTFLFTDVEGSTRLLQALGPDRYAAALGEHRRLMRKAFEGNGGIEVDTQGDAFFVAFPSPAAAFEAARAATDALAAGPIRVRMGLHTGTPLLTEEGYVGEDVHLAARIAAAGHGGQVLVSAATVALLGAEGMVELGEHRVKDFDEPIALFQLGDVRFPPLKTISNTNLPRPASSFVGRNVEVEQVTKLLRDSARLVTLTGPGGSGKTRLAIEAATTIVTEFKAGVFWVDLAPLRDPVLVSETIGRVLGTKDGLAENIGQREMLLVLDNFEQVVEAAPELAGLVEACRNLRLLVTSRERLRVRGEVELPVSPLADPDAVDLFCARAQVEPDETVHQLCLALDNLPLALELAAARASVLSPKQILDRLSSRLDLLKGGRDADPRQQTLRATIDWSHELLAPHDQRLFARLAVFVGGWTLTAAEEIVDASLDGLESLLDKSLVRRTGDRFLMFETIRDYASERLQASGEAQGLRRRHARHFLALAEDSETLLRNEELEGGRQWIDRQARELDNSRAALDWFEASDEPQLMMRMAGALTAVWANPVWASRGLVAEGRRRLQRALALDSSPTLARAKVLDAAAEIAHFGGDIAEVRTLAEQALELYRRFGDRPGMANSLSSLGVALGDSGNWLQARPLLEESLGLFRELGNEVRVMWGTRTLAWAYAELGERKRARVLYEDALRQARAARNELFESVVLGSLSSVAVNDGRPHDSPSLLRESFRIQSALGDRVELAVELAHAAEALAALGQAGAAAHLVSAYEVISEELGGGYPWVTRMNAETVRKVREQLEPTAFETAWEEGSKLTPENAVALAVSALGLTEEDVEAHQVKSDKA